MNFAYKMAEEKGSEADNFLVKILEVMTNNPKGVTNKDLMDSLQSSDNRMLVECLNKLISQQKIQVFQKGNQLVYKLKESNSTKMCQDGDIEEKVILEAIERTGNNGIAPRDLGRQCHLSLPRLKKVLETLERKKLIKCIASTSRRKLYMLYNLEPSHTVTGGIFYSGQEFESEFVDVLGNQIYRYLVQAHGLAEKLSDPISQRNASYKSSNDICTYINGLQISKVKLSLKDIERILDSLIYDDKIEKFVSMSKEYSSKDSGAENLYRITKPLIENGGFMMVPCGVCKVFQDCRVGKKVSPATCEYMHQWLDF